VAAATTLRHPNMNNVASRFQSTQQLMGLLRQNAICLARRGWMSFNPRSGF